MEPERITESEIEKELEQEILYSAIEEDLELHEQQDAIPKKTRAKKKKKKLCFKKEIKIRTLLLLIITLIMNTYAWFIYIATVSVGLNVHIKSWDFELQNGAQTEDFVFEIEEIYPGVPLSSTVKDISAANNGEMEALLSCELVYIRILDQEYSTTTSELESKDEDATLYTSEELLDRLYNKYPFKINIYLVTTDDDGNEVLTLYEGQNVQMPTSSKINIRLQIDWPYEMDGNTINATNSTLETYDAIDTEWGEKAYKYHKDNPDKYSIVVKMDVKAVQKDSNPDADSNTTNTIVLNSTVTDTTTNTVTNTNSTT